MAAQTSLRNAASVLHVVSQVRARDEMGTVRLIKRIRARDAGGTLRTVYDKTGATGSGDVILSTYDSFTDVHGIRKDVTISSDTVTSASSFGTGPYTYHWERVSGSTGIIADTPNASSTKFVAAMHETSEKISSYRLKVTDSLAVIKYSDPVTVELHYTRDH